MLANALKVPSRLVRPNAATPMQQRAVAAFREATSSSIPFRHWLFADALPLPLCEEVISLPLPAAEFEDTYGKRDSHNDMRRFFSPQMQGKFLAMRLIAATFQSAPVVTAIEDVCGILLSGSYLRIEYCQDRNGFWLEPHMDIKEKLITIQIYLNNGEDAATLGTDLYDHEKRFHSSAPSRINQGMIFLPKDPESWHGFEKRPIQNLRRSLIINYVTPDWRSRHELSFPEQPIS